MVKVDVAGAAQHMSVGLVLFFHLISEVRQQFQRLLHIRFVRNRLGHDDDETPLDEFIGQQSVAVDGFTAVSNEHQPRKRPVASHLLIFSLKHRRVDHANFRRKRAAKTEFSPPNGEIYALVAAFEGGAFLKQSQD